MRGLANRRGLYRFCEELGDGVKLTAMYIDIDNFKRINDIYGHGMGDRILIRFADLLRHIIRAADPVGRIGGDEFVALLSNVGIEEVDGLLPKIHEALASFSSESPYKLSVSIGRA